MGEKAKSSVGLVALGCSSPDSQADGEMRKMGKRGRRGPKKECLPCRKACDVLGGRSWGGRERRVSAPIVPTGQDVPTNERRTKKKKRRKRRKSFDRPQRRPFGILAGFVDDVGRFGSRGGWKKQAQSCQCFPFFFFFSCLSSFPSICHSLFWAERMKGRKGNGNGSCLSCN
ncbi:hypothetical protein LZ32DRAFT_459502 [Colletotrichum eremochloae]|nr:hypothetical protein LZ32DRAFT_459502 [Colletotrichum eremochloae]